MTIVSIGLRRLGIRELVRDHWATLYELDRDAKRRSSTTDFAVFYAFPAAAGVAVTLLGVRLHSTGEMLAGIAILTGLLFGLLVHVFSVGLRIADDDRYTSSSRVTILVEELRANVAYSCAIGLLLTMTLVAVASVSSDKVAQTGMAPVWSGVVAGLFLHLILTLLMVLRRVRSAYKRLAK